MNPIEVIFGAIEHAFGAALAGIYAVVPSYGLAIIVLTLAIRFALLPITARATRSMHKMQLLQPHLKELQNRYKDDRARLSKEQMALFKANKASPLSGCLPLIIQMPFLWAFYRVIASGRRRGLAAGAFSVDFFPPRSALATALATTTLAAPTSAAMFLGVNLAVSPVQAIQAGYGIGYVIPQLVLVALIVATGIYQQRQMRYRRANNDTTPNAMQTIGKVMPIGFGVISLFWPAGLNLYWLTSNTFQAAQQGVILKHADSDLVIPAPAPATSAADEHNTTTRPQRARLRPETLPKRVAPKHKTRDSKPARSMSTSRLSRRPDATQTTTRSR